MFCEDFYEKESGGLRTPARLDSFFRVFRVFRGLVPFLDWVARDARARLSVAKTLRSFFEFEDH